MTYVFACVSLLFMEMEIKITINDLLDKGIWQEACEILGFNEWAVNEGLLDGDDIVTLTEEQARTLRLIR